MFIIIIIIIYNLSFYCCHFVVIKFSLLHFVRFSVNLNYFDVGSEWLFYPKRSRNERQNNFQTGSNHNFTEISGRLFAR